jgi:L-asparaginase
MNEATLEAATRAAKKGVVRSRRVVTGTVGRNVSDDEVNFVASDELNPRKARIFLMPALLKTRSRLKSRTCFKGTDLSHDRK